VAAAAIAGPWRPSNPVSVPSSRMEEEGSGGRSSDSDSDSSSSSSRAAFMKQLAGEVSYRIKCCPDGGGGDMREGKMRVGLDVCGPPRVCLLPFIFSK
jgi:hypothetical protein